MQIERIQQFLASGDRRMVALGLAMVAAVAATLVGLLLAVIGPIYATALLIALAAAVWAFWSLENALWSVIGIITVLPFATLPFKIVLTPTFLDLAMGLTFFLYLMQWMTGERRTLTTTPVHPLIVLFALLCVFSFAAGLRYAGMTSTSLRRFAELLLTMAFTLLIVDVVRTSEQLRRMVAMVVLGGVGAALIGIVLWVLPDLLANSLLVRLSIIGYPSGDVIQYIEQNPELSERAIGTSVNPNALGGMLVMVAALTVPQIVSDRPVWGHRWLSIIALGTLVACLILTFSRGSMLAFGVALVFIAALRYRRVLAILIVLGAVILLLPWMQPYLERMLAGLTGADLATQMRFGEYRDALTLILRYPVLGAGFTGSPDIDVYLGVANVYLTITQNMGLVGIIAFFALLSGIFAYAWRARKAIDTIPGHYAIWLGLQAGLLSALVNGVFDHYFFNLEFHFAVTIFWLYVGLMLATSRIALTPPPPAAGPSTR